jgi:hypothetical protein
MKRSRWVDVICIVLLLYAQQQALVHAVWHQALPSSIQHTDPSEASFGSAVCDFDGVFAQVLGAAGVSACRLSLPPLAVSAPNACLQSRAESDPPACRSRGPPFVRS